MMRLLSRAAAGMTLAVGLSAGALSPASAGPQQEAGDDRLPAAVTVHTADYDFELIAQDSPDKDLAVVAYVRRTDDVGRGFEDVPDSHGNVQASSWNAQRGQRCLTSSGGVFSFDDSADHAFTYGLAGRKVRRVEVVLADGSAVGTSTTQVVADGFRAWMVERPLGDIARVDGYDQRGGLIATATPSFPGFGDFAQSDTCIGFPFP